MYQRLTHLFAIAGVALILAGCAGGGLGALLGLIGIGGAVGQIEDLFGSDTDDDADVLLDGQVIRTISRGTSELRLRGLPEGRHLLQVVATEFRGIVRLIDVDAESDLQLGSLEAEDGGMISGRVTMRDTDGSTRAAVRVPVYAIPGGAVTVAEGQPVTTIPPAGTHYVAYTDGNGQFVLNAVTAGDYLVTATVAGYMADVQLIDGLQATQRKRNTDLELVQDANAPSGRAQGIASGRTGGGSVSLGGASIRAQLAAGYAPAIPQATIARIQNAYGADLRAAPWFRWNVLSTLADNGGSYVLPLPPGTHRVDAFAYNYQPAYRDVAITANATTGADFTLDAR